MSLCVLSGHVEDQGASNKLLAVSGGNQENISPEPRCKGREKNWCVVVLGLLPQGGADLSPWPPRSGGFAPLDEWEDRLRGRINVFRPQGCHHNGDSHPGLCPRRAVFFGEHKHVEAPAPSKGQIAAGLWGPCRDQSMELKGTPRSLTSQGRLE